MRIRRANPILTVVCGLLAAGLTGCLFETREPEKGGGEVCFESSPSTEVDFVFGNLDGSMECRQAPSYLDQLSDDFVFVASPGVQAQFPGVFPDENAWGIAEEEAFVDRLFADADSIQSDLKMTEIDRSGTQVVEIEAEYRVRVVTGGSAITYTGVAFYTLRQEATTWFLTRWEDTASANPIGLLRGGLAPSR